LLGLLLLVPALRLLLGRGLRRRLRWAAAPADPTVVDLSQEDWRTVPEPRLDRRDAGRQDDGKNSGKDAT
jgi:hypothetical protein